MNIQFFAMRNSGRGLLIVSALLCAAILAAGGWAIAQTASTTPFFSATPTAYEAQIATGDSGVLLNVKPIVSANLKYVTVGTQATSTGLATLTPFNLVIPANGTVGATSSSTPGGAAASSGRGAAAAAPEPAHVPTILDKPGMTLIARLPQ
jgi:hypothetical protein